MQNPPLVSIIMPAYNAEKYIIESIESILNQSYTNFELLISDDGSIDRTREIIDEYLLKDSRIKCFHNEINLGYLKTCNKLFAKSNGDYLTTQDSDDLSHIERLEKQVEFLTTQQIDCCFVLHNNIDENGMVFDESKELPQNDEEIKLRLESDFPWLPNPLMIKRVVYEEVGGYNEYFDRICAEDHYWVGLMASKYKFGSINQVLYFWRKHHESVTHSIERTEKFYTSDIARVLYLQKRHLHRKDSLESSNEIEMRYIEDSFKELYKHIPHLLVYRYLFKYLRKGRFSDFRIYFGTNRSKIKVSEFLHVLLFYFKKRFFYDRYFNLNVRENKIFK